VARIVMIPLVVILFYAPYPWAAPACGSMFILAAVTDSLDGYLARRLGQTSALGAFLEERGTLRRVGDGLAVSPALYERGREALSGLDPITLAGFRDVLGVGRRTAQLLLERYDADGLTLRRGDLRVLRRRRA